MYQFILKIQRLIIEGLLLIDPVTAPSISSYILDQDGEFLEWMHNATMILDLADDGHYDGSRDAHGLMIGEGFIPSGQPKVVMAELF